MNRRNPRALSALLLGLAMAGCNDLIGASEPDAESALGGDGDDADGESAEEAALCGNGALDQGEQCDDSLAEGCSECLWRCGPFPDFEWSVTGGCYHFLEGSSKTWREAQDACDAWGGHLAAITDVEELAEVQQHIREDVWIGGRDPAGAESFQWVTGEAWFNGFAAEPASDASEACVMIDGDELAFERAPCDLQVGYVCERAQAPAP